MAADIAGGVLGFATSFMDNMWNSYNVEQTNAANRAIADQTNQYNAQIARENREYDRLVRAQDWSHYLETDQEAYRRFLENREYESLGSQMQRLREQGINPYLAMYGNGGHVGSSGGSVPSVGSPPSGHNGNNQPFAQTGAPMQAYTGGLGLTQGLANLLALSQDEREDYKLASDITFRDYEARNRHLEYLLHKSSNKSESDWYKAQIQDLDRKWKLEKDKLQHIIDWDNFQKEVVDYQTRQRDFELRLQEMATKSGIKLNSQQASTLYAQQNLFESEAVEMAENGVAKRNLLRTQKLKEDKIVDLLIQDYEQEHGQLSWEQAKKYRIAYKRVAKWLLDPVTGVFSVGANVSSKIK